jgi:hypothetical protein
MDLVNRIFLFVHRLSYHQFEIKNHVNVNHPSYENVEVYPLVKVTLATVVVVSEIEESVNR